MKPFKVAVMYGSQTGNAQSIAEGVHEGCQTRGLESTLLKCDAWKKMSPDLKEWDALVLVVSTTGNGDPPENSERFWRFIKRRTQPKDLLAGLPFALLGLGDTNYDKFCYMGKSFDKRLKELGAAPFHAPAFADEATNMEETIEPWLAGLYSSLESLADADAANNAEEEPPQAVAEEGLEEASQAGETPAAANGQRFPSGAHVTGRGEEGNGEQATAAAKTGGSSAGAGTVAESRSAPALATTLPSNGSGGVSTAAAGDSAAAADETKAPPTPQQPPTAAVAAGDSGGEVLSKAGATATAAAAAAAGGGESKAVTAPGGSEPLPTHRIAVMYGSQTGNAKSIAEGIHDGCKERGLTSTLLGCDGWKKMSPELKEWSALVITVSTTGNGDAPENTERFWRFLKRRTQPKDLLQGLPFALLGLGDTNYDKFCYMGKSLDKRLRELGAVPFHAPAFADEATNMEETIEPWLASLYPALRATIVGAAGGAVAAVGAAVEGAAAAAATAVPTKAADGSPAPATAAATAVPTKAANGSPAPAAAAAGSEDAVKEAIKGAAAEAFQLPPVTAAAAAAGTTAKKVAGTNGGGGGGNATGSTAKSISGPNGAPAVPAAAAAVTVAAAASSPAPVEAAAAALADLTLADDGAAAAAAATSPVVEPGAAPTPPLEQTSGGHTTTTTTNNNNGNDSSNSNGTSNGNGNSGGGGDAPPAGQPPQQRWSPRAESGARPLPDFLAPEHLEPGYSPARSDLPRARPSAADVKFHISTAAAEAGEAEEEEQPWLRRARQRSSSVESRHTLDWPFSARVKSARYLTEGGRGADRRVINMELSLRGSGITYVPGDVIGFRCPNRAADTAYLLERLQATLPEGAGPDVPFQHSLRSLPSPCTLRDALSTRLDLQAPLRRPVLRALSEFCGDLAERAWMELLCSKTAGAGVYASYVAAQSLTLCELLEAFPSCKPRPGALLALLPPLPPRYYSVASSQLATPDSLTVAFSVASLRLPHAPAAAAGDTGAAAAAAAAAAALPAGGGVAVDGTGSGDGGGGFVTRPGLCTNWLEGILAPFLEGNGRGGGGAAVSVPVFLKPTKEFLLPGSAKWPCVLIGPGTGVSPFIGFLKHREEQHARRREEADAVCSGYWRGGYEISLEGEDDETAAYRGREGRGDMWLFFGCRNESQDWIFRREMEDFLEKGTLSKLSTAFSRDASEKVYVQHRIREHGAELSRLMLQQGAYVYVCGDGNAMAQGVHRALVEALVEHGGAGVEGEKGAEAALRAMKEKSRYVLDVWS